MNPLSTTRAGRIAAVVMLGAALAAGSGCASNRTTQSPGEYVDDAAVTTSVKTALLGETGIHSSDINVETFRGSVQLSGFVDNQTQIDRAVTVARAQNGVHSVKNDLRIKTGS